MPELVIEATRPDDRREDGYDRDKNKISKNISVDQQTDSYSCALFAINGLERAYGGTNETGNLAYAAEFAANPAFKGLSPAEVFERLNENFNVNELDSHGGISDAIDNDHPVMAGVENEHGNPHEVIITGYDEEEREYTVMAPGTGSREQYDYDSVHFDWGVYEIEGRR